MTTMSRTEVLRRRIATQRLTAGLSSATEVVRLLTCVQSQEYAHGFWSLGMRTTGSTFADVLAEFDAGRFVRTHILRPTWHYVAAEDLRWILSVTSPRVHQLNGTMYRREQLTPAELDRAAQVIVTELADGNYLTRAELGRVLGATGFRLVYLVMYAELEGLIVNGPMRKAQHTYAVVDEWVTDSAGGDAAELARRFFVGHGPASIKDFARWSSLTLAQGTEAVEAVADQLVDVEVEGITHYLGRDAPDPAEMSPALLLPLYDELPLSYPMINFPLADAHPHPPGEDQFVGSVVLDQTNVGTWRREVRGKKMIMEIAVAPTVTAAGRAALAEQAQRLATFLGRQLVLSGLDRV